MDMNDIHYLRAVLPEGRTVYPYYPDRYSLQLLRYAVRRPTAIAALRAGPVARLLQKPRVKALLANCGQTLTPERLTQADGDPEAQAYTLSLAHWGTSGSRRQTRWQQTSRASPSLVLQLNFSQGHNRALRQLLNPQPGQDPFNVESHPCLRRPGEENRRYTLAWARLDVDLDKDEALIEEIQTDWIRRVHWAQARLAGTRRPEYEQAAHGLGGDPATLAERLHRYASTMLAPHEALWAEAMLSAALFFLREELGIRQVHMHTPESGVAFKRITGRAPPQSLYTDLPARFCFQRRAPGSAGLPAMLSGEAHLQRLCRHSPQLCLQTLAI